MTAMKFERITLGVDGFENSRIAAEWAAELARLVDAEVVAVHAVGLLEPLDSGDLVPSFHHHGEIRHLFETAWCAPL
jgi:nucleotide-binding universal stress UspA family protein